MTRVVKPEYRDGVKMERNFSVFFEEKDSGEPGWPEGGYLAHVIGCDDGGIDWLTHGVSATTTAYMVADLIAMMTDTCIGSPFGPDDVRSEHDFSIESSICIGEDEGVPPHAAWQCSHCHLRRPVDHFEELPDE